MTAPSTILQVAGLGIRFGGIAAVQEVALTIGENELVCVIGPNGAGKSSLIGLVSGFLKPGSGRVHVGGRDATGRPVEHFVREGVVRKFQGTNVFPWLSAHDNLLVAGLGVASSRSGESASVDSVLALVGLADRADVVAEVLSHGERQWLELGMALMCRPRLLLLDEPAAGLNPDETQRLAALLRDTARGCAVVVVEHDMGFVRRLACRTLVMHQGRLVRDGRFEDIEADAEIRELYLGRQRVRAGSATC
ncbi:ABC transporter ATP-binding protein [Aquabacterium humicola]|uniref:ABC transporter ATP-binding protein n=1 Tax=Aquabacterium humicola TaxID=3237377 RepID=UPI002542B4D5|nr:ABC transporter ATP-binding protein [Rubrivivax pictus]